MTTKPKKFNSAAQIIDLWQKFCDEIIDNGFVTIPSQTSFCRWLANNYEKTDRKTIYNTLNKIFPTVKKDFEAIRADTISEGTMLGKYQPSMSIFALKNWCSWKDKIETDTSEDVLAKLDEVLEHLGE
jgi:hypothetical protein